MAGIKMVFWDVGGVLLTNGWDTDSRQQAVRRFGMEWELFEESHQEIVECFETGGLRLGKYLEEVLPSGMEKDRKQEFREFMLARSRLHPHRALDVVDRVAAAGGPAQATLNNESLDLNLHRIARFDLASRFSAFFSSSFLGVKKPDPLIYRKALWITQRDADQCLFIDDREENLEPARELGMRTILFREKAGLTRKLQALGLI